MIYLIIYTYNQTIVNSIEKVHCDIPNLVPPGNLTS